MPERTYLTGITTSGRPHLGNYVGAIRPAIAASTDPSHDSFFFLADYHALIKGKDPERLRASRREIAAAWLAFGLDTERVTFYRQSDVPQILELTWMLTCQAAKGLMNRAHAYKAVVQENLESRSTTPNGENAATAQPLDRDPDRGITMGLFSYPILMAADILMFRATHVPVGRDQVQHIEMARDMAQRFNHHYGEHLVLPDAVVGDDTAILTGLDGRKMSKSYDNTIALFDPPKKLRKSIMKIVTNSQEPGEPKEPDGNTVFDIYSAFATPAQSAELRDAYAGGIGWGDAKQRLFELVDGALEEPRRRFEALMAHPDRIEDALQHGGEKARARAAVLLEELRDAVGIAESREVGA